MFFSKFFSQFQGVDYTNTFAPIAKMDSIRLILAIDASKPWDNFMLSLGFERCKSDPNVYLQHVGDVFQVIVLYFDYR